MLPTLVQDDMICFFTMGMENSLDFDQIESTLGANFYRMWIIPETLTSASTNLDIRHDRKSKFVFLSQNKSISILFQLFFSELFEFIGHIFLIIFLNSLRVTKPSSYPFRLPKSIVLFPQLKANTSKMTMQIVVNFSIRKWFVVDRRTVWRKSCTSINFHTNEQEETRTISHYLNNN